MTKSIRVTYCGMDGEGATVAAAKQDAARKIERVLSDIGQPPVIVAIGRQAALVAYAGAGYGWGSRLLTDEHGSVRQGQQYISFGREDRREAIVNAAKHVAQAAWTHAIEDDGEWLAENKPEAVSVVDWRSATRDLVEYFGSQRRYTAARAAGHDDNEVGEG